MKAVKDKKKFGYNKNLKINLQEKGIKFDKEQRKQRRKFIKQMKHKCDFNIPWTEEEKRYLSNLKYKVLKYLFII